MAANSKYVILRDEGASPDDVYHVAQQDNLENRVCLEMLKELFSLSIAELCDIRARYASGATNDAELQSYYEKLAHQIADAMEQSRRLIKQQPDEKNEVIPAVSLQRPFPATFRGIVGDIMYFCAASVSPCLCGSNVF